jgi:hypothetical protein
MTQLLENQTTILPSGLGPWHLSFSESVLAAREPLAASKSRPTYGPNHIHLDVSIEPRSFIVPDLSNRQLSFDTCIAQVRIFCSSSISLASSIQHNAHWHLPQRRFCDHSVCSWQRSLAETYRRPQCRLDDQTYGGYVVLYFHLELYNHGC